MTKARNEFIYQFKGTITKRELTKASPPSKYAGQAYYKLHTSLENQPNKIIQVFADKLTNPQIWTTLQSTKPRELVKNKYLFSCRNQRGYYYLVNMEEQN